MTEPTTTNRVETQPKMTNNESEETGEPQKLSIFQRLCLCCSNDTKEPPVQLIRSGSLTYQQGQQQQQASNVVITAAKTSVDDGQPPQAPTVKQLKKVVSPDDDSIHMNDVLLGRILGSDEDKTEAVEEDNVSIATDVIQEVDDTELNKALKKKESAKKQLKGRSGITKDFESVSIHSDQGQGEDRKMSVIEFIRAEAEADDEDENDGVVTASPAIVQNEKLSEATQSEMSDSDDEASEETDDKRLTFYGVSSNTTARADKNNHEERPEIEEEHREFREFSTEDETTSDEEDEVAENKYKLPTVGNNNPFDEESDDEDVPPLPAVPPPRLTSPRVDEMAKSPIPPPRSPRDTKMYEHADSDSDSDEEDDNGNNHPIGGGLSKMQPVYFAPKKEKEEDDVSLSSINSSDSVDLPTSSESLADKENGVGITRISVKSDGRAEIHSPRSPVRVTMDTDRQMVTDDEFSEKLI